MALRLRMLTDEERVEVRRLAQARAAPARGVERARIIWGAAQGKRAPAIARDLGISAKTARTWIARFNTQGVAGLADAARGGRPPTYTPDQVSALIAAVLAQPTELDLPYACWTLDRLATYLSEAKRIGMKRSRIGEILLAEGLRWRTQETWFGERVDPAFAEKRGPSSSSTPRRQPTASSCA